MYIKKGPECPDPISVIKTEGNALLLIEFLLKEKGVEFKVGKNRDRIFIFEDIGLSDTEKKEMD